MNTQPKSIFELCDVIRQTAFEIHRYLGTGHLEKVYENALMNRLGKLKIEAKSQFPLAVFDEDGTILGDYVADLFIDGRLIVEIKAVKSFHDEHIAQLLGYLKTARIEHGLLINFGSYRFQIRKFVLSQAVGVPESVPDF